MFVKGQKYENRNGRFTVLKIVRGRMIVKYDNGTEQKLDIQLQERIVRNFISKRPIDQPAKQQHVDSVTKKRSTTVPTNKNAVVNAFGGHPLAQWQDRLNKHFLDLREKRNSVLSDAPIYALEHGLDENELDDLMKDVRRSRLNADQLNRIPPLPWIIYATEYGYKYDGKRYWHQFEPETPWWIDSHGQKKKDFIIYSFEQFQKQFGGVRPSGDWDNHYPYISWPIRNAILPKHHQRELAKVLWESRRDFNERIFETPVRLGELILSKSKWYGSKQFVEFAGNTEVNGHIAIAILGHEFESISGILETKCLERIRSDLYLENQTQSWIKESTDSARTHLKNFKGFGSSQLTGTTHSQRKVEDEATKLQIEPRFFLKHNRDRWDVYLRVPSLAPLARNFERVGAASAIRSNRVTVRGGDPGRLPPRGNVLLRMGYDVPMVKWPAGDEPLLNLDAGPEEVRSVLAYSSRHGSPTTKLFKVSADRTRADELQSLHVLAGSTYVVLVQQFVITPPNSWEDVSTNCEGIDAFIIRVPDPVPPSFKAELREQGIGVREDYELRSAGLSPISHDSQRIELYNHEPHILQFRTSASPDMVTFSLQSSPGFHDSLPAPGGEWHFLQLPKLEIGLHQLNIEIASNNQNTSENLNVVVKERPEPRADDRPLGQFAMLVLDPETPSFEELWERRIALEVRGPRGYSIECNVTLLDHDSKPIMTKPVYLSSLPLPILKADWNAAFKRFVDEVEKQDSSAYHNCDTAVLEFKIDDIWYSKLNCERLFTPARLQTKRFGKELRARLVSNANPLSTSILRSNFATPAKFDPIPSTDHLDWFEQFMPIDRGLFIAITDQSFSSIISAPTKLPLNRIREALIDPKIGYVPGSVDEITSLLNKMAYWERANHSGSDILNDFKEKVLKEFQRVASESTLNSNFISQLNRLRNQPNQASLVKLIENYRSNFLAGPRKGDRLALMLNETATRCVESSPDNIVQTLHDTLIMRKQETGIPAFLEVSIERHSIHWLIEFALRMVTKPSTLHHWASGDLKSGVGIVLSNKRFLLHTAYFFEALITYKKMMDADRNSASIDSNWEWY